MFLKISAPHALYSCTVVPAQSKNREQRRTDKSVKCHLWRCQRNEYNTSAGTTKKSGLGQRTRSADGLTAKRVMTQMPVLSLGCVTASAVQSTMLCSLEF